LSPSSHPDDGQAHAAVFADRLFDYLNAAGHHCIRLASGNPVVGEEEWRINRGPRRVAIADGSIWGSQPPGDRERDAKPAPFQPIWPGPQ
jgi:hypothetical protein